MEGERRRHKGQPHTSFTSCSPQVVQLEGKQERERERERGGHIIREMPTLDDPLHGRVDCLHAYRIKTATNMSNDL